MERRPKIITSLFSSSIVVRSGKQIHDPLESFNYAISLSTWKRQLALRMISSIDASTQSIAQDVQKDFAMDYASLFASPHSQLH
jgi:hypothetical protein